MQNIPLELILINPEVDVFLFIFFLYFFFSKYFFSGLVVNKNIFWQNLKITTLIIALGFLNYSGTDFEIFKTKVSWITYIILVQILIEISFTFFRKN